VCIMGGGGVGLGSYFLKVGVETKRQGDKTQQERFLPCMEEYE
jgi:hypothetical protein